MEQTIPAFLAAAVERRGDESALGTIRDGELTWRTWREIWSDVQALAAALPAAGIAAGDRVAQVSENSYEWIVSDLALHTIAAVHVPIHVSHSGQQIAEQIVDCGARLVFASSEEVLAKFVGQLSADVRVLVHEEHGERSYEALLDEPLAPSYLAPRPQPPGPDSLATILYTSGTTGRPRGVMLSQQNLAWNAQAVADVHGSTAEQTRLNILPFSHIYARTCDLYTWVYRGSRLVLAESRATLLRDCQLTRPTTFSGVPYIYQRIADAVRASGSCDPAAAFGGRIERLTCGGATLAPEYEAWYAEAALPVTCGYGLTEASPVVTMSTRDEHRAGHVGRPLPGVDVRLADDGEILVRSPGVMLGYWQNDAATSAAIRDGWLCTGDLGEFSDDGYLRIRGRRDEMIVLSTGKNVAPARVESLLTASPLIEQAAVFGDGRPGLVALIVPNAACGLAAAEPATQDSQIAAECQRCLATASSEEQIRDVIIASRPFAIDRGELTPKMSLCRTVIMRNFAQELSGILEPQSSPRGVKKGIEA